MLDSNRNMCALWAYFGNKKEFESVMFMGAESPCEVPGQGTCLTAVSFECPQRRKVMSPAVTK